MRQDKTKITVKFNKIDNNVLGYFPNDIDYHNELFIDSDEIGYIEITKEIWENRPAQAIVNGNSIEEYQRPKVELLAQAKLAKIAQLKKNRDIANISPMLSHQAKEIIFDEVVDDFVVTNNDVYFKFKLDPTGFSQTESTTICMAVVISGMINPSYFLRYSCEIIEGETLRKGYVAITAQIAGSIMTHGSNRITQNTSFCNALETQINAIEIIEDEVTYEQAIEALNNINITF